MKNWSKIKREHTETLNTNDIVQNFNGKMKQQHFMPFIKY